MAKKAEKQEAYVYYVKKGWLGKDTAKQVGVTEATMSKWVNEGGWDDLRTATKIGPQALIKTYYALLNKLLDKRLAFENEDKTDNKEYRGLVDEISKISKSIRDLEDKEHPSLHVYIQCVERFCKDLREKNPKLFLQVVELQKESILKYAKELEVV
jgi:hypothetical protein